MKQKMEAIEVLEQARKNRQAIGAFNAGSLEIVKAIAQAAKQKNSPVIVETSLNEANYFGKANFLSAIENIRQQSDLVILTNFDHGPGIEECQSAIDAGYQIVHFDGSGLPYEENVKITKNIADLAHQKGILLEAEFNKIPGSSEPHSEEGSQVQDQSQYTDPDMAADFFSKTGCDILAVFIGNLHGTYASEPRLDLPRLEEIKEKVGCFLSLHGGSGLPDNDVAEAIKMGVVKININTELRVVYKQTLENVLRGSEEVAIYKIMPPVIAAVQKVVEDKISLFSPISNASEDDEINHLSLE